ncbi:MAG: bifunctional 2-polyprenyl-6-hydroxyphenol methylase/3-demethylubiquinol 3-O-methyltransferase UbiG [Gammaproteobacteria bacterium]|nr:bifunctional 2-polyprenyl-6-hydroxyphenol methylase/3-demethylubiquinol 3-O-methyltransferase UbiG [Gammaproteobacteria bacterium]
MNEQTTHNVDPEEVAKFEAMASRWWDKESEFKPLHDINPLRLDFIDQHANGIEHKKVIDVGCGGGILSESMALRGAQVTGIDMGKSPLTVARLHQIETGVEVDYQQTTAEAFASDHPQHFDVVSCMEMLEHVPDPASVIQACSQMTKPGGRIFFSTINRNPKAYMLAIIGAEYILGMLPKGTHDYSKFIQPSELDRWAREAGLQLEKLAGMTYNPLTREYKIEHNVDVNYLVCYRKD